MIFIVIYLKETFAIVDLVVSDNHLVSHAVASQIRNVTFFIPMGDV